MAIVHHEGYQSRANFPLGNDDKMFAFALYTCFGPANQLVGALSRHQDEPKLTVDALWKFHFDLPHGARIVDRDEPEPDGEIEWACRRRNGQVRGSRTALATPFAHCAAAALLKSNTRKIPNIVIRKSSRAVRSHAKECPPQLQGFGLREVDPETRRATTDKRREELRITGK